MKIIYDENKIPEIKQSANEKNEKLFSECKEQYNKNIRLFTILSIVIVIIAVICFSILLSEKNSSQFSLMQFVILVLSIPIGAIMFLFRSMEKEGYEFCLKSYEKKTDKFSYPASVKYNLFIEDKKPHSFNISGNPEDKFVSIEVLAKNSEEKIETITLYDFEVSRSIDNEDIIIDLMDKRVIYPLEDKSQEFEFYPVFDGDILKKI